ncbi:hypothetical protein ACOSP7_019184 [Xanthoceras sorbifolium]
MSHVGDGSRAPRGKRRSRPRIVHPQYAEHLKKAEKRAIKSECSIDIDALDDTGIPKVVRGRQWEHFVQHPNDASDKLVREFYTSMVSDDFFVWGTMLKVDEYYGLLNFPQAPGGMEVHQFFIVHSLDLAGSLRMTDRRCWSNSNNYDLFYHVFCDHSNLPKMHRTTLTLPVTSVLLSLQQAAIGGKTLVPNVPLGHAMYNKLANVRRHRDFHVAELDRGLTSQMTDQREMRIKSPFLRFRAHSLIFQLYKARTAFSRE